MTDSRTWIIQGAVVAECTLSTTTRVRVTTIARLTDTQVVTATGRHYRRSDLQTVGQRTHRLLPTTDPDVRDALARDAYAGLAASMDAALRPYATSLVAAEVKVELIEELTAATRGQLAAIRAGDIRPE